jgi:hypothetical protein
MEQDDFSLMVHADLKNAVKRFVERYQKGPLILSKRTPVPPSNVNSAIIIEDPLDEAMKIVTQIEHQMTNQHSFHVPLVKGLCDLMLTLSRGTFLSPPTTTSPHESKHVELALFTILSHHIPIHDVDDLMLTYLDSGMFCFAAIKWHPIYVMNINRFAWIWSQVN